MAASCVRCENSDFLVEIAIASKSLTPAGVWTKIISFLGYTGLLCDRMRSGPHVNIKTVFLMYGDSHVKDKTVSRWDRLIFNMRIPILLRRHLYIEAAPRLRCRVVGIALVSQHIFFPLTVFRVIFLLWVRTCEMQMWSRQWSFLVVCLWHIIITKGTIVPKYRNIQWFVNQLDIWRDCVMNFWCLPLHELIRSYIQPLFHTTSISYKLQCNRNMYKQKYCMLLNLRVKWCFLGQQQHHMTPFTFYWIHNVFKKLLFCMIIVNVSVCIEYNPVSFCKRKT